MKSGDEALAASALQEHLNAVFTSIRLLLDENSAYFLSEESLSLDKAPLSQPADPPREDQAKTRKKAGSDGLKPAHMIKGA